jgi:plastocyanin
MKITEITNEGFGEFTKNAGRAVSGAAMRKAQDMTRGMAGKLGFAGQAEKQKMQRIAGGVAKNFARYIAQRGLKQDTEAVQQYLTALGFNPADIKISSGNTAKFENKIHEIGSAMAGAQGGVQPSQAQQPSQKAQPLNRNELIKTIADTIQTALQNNRVPKAIEKFTKV